MFEQPNTLKSSTLKETGITSYQRFDGNPSPSTRKKKKGSSTPHDDPMIIRVEIADLGIGRVLIDTGNLVNIIFADIFGKLGINDNHVNRQLTPLLTFSGDLVQSVCSVSLTVSFGVALRKTMVYDQFLIVDCPKAYNVIIRRTTLTKISSSQASQGHPHRCRNTKW
ncbi:unnamed protein product [Prunus armeniaca]